MLLIAGCGRAEPEDGGEPLQRRNLGAPFEQMMAHDPCFRREHGYWHQSVGHCRPMTGPERLQGVWMRGFELSEFVPGARSFAEAAQREARAHDIELDEERVQRLAGVRHKGPGAGGYFISFIGRRTRDPHSVDCQGNARFTVVVDRLLAAGDAGAEAPSALNPPPGVMEAEYARLRAIPVTVAVRHGGEWGKREAEAVRFCRLHRDTQTPSQSSPSGSSSAL